MIDPQLHMEKKLLYRDPHAILGIHNQQIILWRPGATEVWVELQGNIIPLDPLDEEGFFYTEVAEVTPKDYRVYQQNGSLTYDPYAFWPTFSEVDRHLFNQGCHYELGRRMGARETSHQEVEGVKFSVWAPNARAVTLVGDFNHWNDRVTPMRLLDRSGIWEIFLPGTWEGMKYKFCITDALGRRLWKADPFALGSELRPQTASIIRSQKNFLWEDHAWMERRSQKGPLIIYEVHLGSWRRSHERHLNYRELAQQLIDYCIPMGFTHVEFLPIMEHPLDESWGYQTTGYFAPTSRYGTLEDFQWMVNALHKAGLGVLLDWVPGHFPSDPHGLAQFDGTCLYEHLDPKMAWHPHWHTLCFNYGRHEVSNFLLANALFWLEDLHVDGLRVDAVASMLYLDYGKEEREWVPNRYGGRENLEAIEFLKHCNHIIRTRIPDALILAEESTSWPGVTAPVELGGLGFTHKWNMGWMHDTLRYLSRDPIHRGFHQGELTFGLLYAFYERFCLVLSHDEVVHGKGSLLRKMPGDLWQKFAHLRALLAYQATYPGTKLLFMGNELGQWEEWSCKEEAHWFLLQYPLHKGIQTLVAALNHLQKKYAALWSSKNNWEEFEWVDFQDTRNSVISYLRKSEEQELLVVHHFTAQYIENYEIRLPGIQQAIEILNTDEEDFGGTGKLNPTAQILREPSFEGLRIHLAPLATMVFQISRW